MIVPNFKAFDIIQSFNAIIELILEFLPNQSLQRLKKILVVVYLLKFC